MDMGFYALSAALSGDAPAASGEAIQQWGAVANVHP
jgi:hypothetical protein